MPNLMKAFDVKEEKVSVKPVKDYDIFKDKELLDSLRNTIISNLIDDKVPNNKLLHEYINDEIDKALLGYDLTNLERSHIFNLIDNEINGYGPITELLEDPNITEIMVNGKNEVYVEIDGQISKDDSVSFINDEHIIRTVQKIVQPLGRTIDTANPMVDARLEDGSRLNAVIPPLSLKGPVVTIRKFRRDMERIDDFLRTGAMTPYMARFLDAAVKAKLNIIICGGTGAGKTTLLNALSSFIGDHERIITIEDAAELKLNQSHVISLETRLVNYEGTGEVTIRDLVNAKYILKLDIVSIGLDHKLKSPRYFYLAAGLRELSFLRSRHVAVFGRNVNSGRSGKFDFRCIAGANVLICQLE